MPLFPHHRHPTKPQTDIHLGEYRFEVLLDDDGVGTVALLFSVFADGQPPAMPSAPLPPERNPDPREAEAWLMESLNELRGVH